MEKKNNMRMLHVIGAGPGPSDLMTVRALKLLQETELVFAAASSTREYSRCLETVRPWLPENARCVRLDFPMTMNQRELHAAWAKAAATCHQEMLHSAVFLTLGDPLIYSTFIYLYRSVKKLDPEIGMDIVPGITSFQAAAAAFAQPLCEGKGGLRIVSGTASPEMLEKELLGKDCVVILKVYRNSETILKLLRKTGRLESAMLASRIGLPDEQMICNLADYRGQPPYLSLIISPSD